MPQEKTNLAENEAQFRAAFNQAAVGISHVRFDGKFVLVNDYYCKMLGYERSELLEKNIADITHPDDLVKNRDAVQTLLADSTTSLKLEKRNLRKGGSVIWVQLTLSSIRNGDNNFAYIQAIAEDISTRKNLESKLHLSNRALESLSSGVVLMDVGQTSRLITYANPAFCRMMGFAPNAVLGADFFALQNGDAAQPGMAILHDALKNKAEMHTVLSNRRADGATIWNELFISPVADEQGTITHLIAIQTDITDQKHVQEQVAFQATHDELTGLPNRILLMDLLQHAIARASTSSSAVALLFLGIDNFKLINDSIDHSAGDQLLKAVAERLSDHVEVDENADVGPNSNAGAILARHGGDEFAIVLTDIDDASKIIAICEQLAETIAQPYSIGDRSLHVTCSIGVALYPQDGLNAATLFKYADMALCRAKELGRGNSQFYSSDMNQRTVERVTLEHALRAPAFTDQLHLHYQPLVDLQTGKIAGLEALVRWEHPEFGFVSPVRFIPVAEESGLIASIGEWVLLRACRDMRDWADHGLPPVRVAINVSPRQFRDPDLALKIGAALTAMRIDPGLLCLEITETVIMQDTPSSVLTLKRLKALGVDLVLDDFGTGFSSLSYLKRFPFNKVKIDRSFVQDIVRDGDDAAISKAIISMAHSLGIRVVAEGVETEAQCNFLSQNMCDEMQGFLFSKAVASGEIEILLREGRQLPGHLLRLQKATRSLLLVDDEINIVASLKRLLRRDNYQIFTANSGQEGLDLLAQHEVDVIVSDQRMPGMTGVDFLRIAKRLYPDTMRIVLSGYSELQSVTAAVNEGAIYKFFSKPWEDDQLREHVADAFRIKEMADENQRLNLEVRTANQHLAAANRQLEEVLKEKQEQIVRDEVSLEIVREALQYVPMPVLGLDEDDVIVFANDAALSLFSHAPTVLGADAGQLIPLPEKPINGRRSHDDAARDVNSFEIELNGLMFHVKARTMGHGSSSRGRLLTLTQYGAQFDAQYSAQHITKHGPSS